MIACLQIFLDDSFKKGDNVVIGDHPQGVVENIGLRSTILRYTGGQLAQIPNTVVIGSKIENFSRAKELGTNCKIKINGISSALLQTLIEKIRMILEETEGVYPSFRHVSFSGLEGNGRVIQIIIRSSPDWEETQYLLEKVNLKILKLLEQHNIAQIDYEFLYAENHSPNIQNSFFKFTKPQKQTMQENR